MFVIILKHSISRIERFWRDLWIGCISIYYNLFQYMQQKNILDDTNPIDMLALHIVYIPRIQSHIHSFIDMYSHRPLRTERNQTPYQLWTQGMVKQNLSSDENVCILGTKDLSY